MRTSPVSFGSIMVFTINDGKPKADTGDMIRTAFKYNYDLAEFKLLDTIQYTGEEIDGSVYNAAPSFAQLLDKKYRDLVPKGSNKVVLTEADFYVNPREKQKRYFITANSDREESRLQRILGQGMFLFAAKFYDKK